MRELVTLDPEGLPGAQLRVWDRVDDALCERAVENACARSLPLGCTWTIAPAEGNLVALRIATGPNLQLYPTRAEARETEAQAREVETQARKAEARAREAAEARVLELEALLKQT